MWHAPYEMSAPPDAPWLPTCCSSIPPYMLEAVANDLTNSEAVRNNASAMLNEINIEPSPIAPPDFKHILPHKSDFPGVPTIRSVYDHSGDPDPKKEAYDIFGQTSPRGRAKANVRSSRQRPL
jgi:hypothetical protein